MPAQTGSGQLDKLKRILLHSEQEKLTRLETELLELYKRMDDKERLIETLDPVIADLLYKKIMEARGEMAEALAPVMGDALRAQISEAKDDIADALHPVIGKTVRKSVAEAMKNLMQAINERIDALVGGSKKIDRLTLLKEVFPFYVQQIFYIHKETGLLLAHAAYQEGGPANEEMISGMLTAIRSFAQTAFDSGDQTLHEIQYDDLNIIMEEGKYAYLAFVVSGVPTATFKEVIAGLEHKLHLQYFKQMRHFDGDTRPFAPIQESLARFIASIHDPMYREAMARRKNNRKRGLIIILSVLLIVFSGLWLTQTDPTSAEETFQTIVNQYQSKPGAFVQFSKDGEKVTVWGTLFATDRTDLLKQLDALGLEVDASRLFVMPSSKSLQNTLDRVTRELNLKNSLHVLVDTSRLTVTGRVPDEALRQKAARLFARYSGLPLVWNALTVAPSTKEPRSLDAFTVYFPTASSTPDSVNRGILDRLKTYLAMHSYDTLYIHGYADNSGRQTTNEQLAKERARTVKQYLTRNGIPEHSIQTSYRVLPQNRKGKNRKVTFTIR